MGEGVGGGANNKGLKVKLKASKGAVEVDDSC